MAETSRSQLRRLKDEYARNPGSRVFVHLAEAYRKAGELRQAQQVLTEGLRRHVDDPSGLVVLARVLTDQGDVERAAGVWRDVLRQDPENVVALRSLAELADSAGRRDEAMQLFRRVVRLENGEPDVDEPVAAPARFDDEEEDVPAPVASAPAPASVPEPAVAAPSKSRFSWLVRTLVGEPAAAPPAPSAGRDLLAAPEPEAQPAPEATSNEVALQGNAEQEETVFDVAASRDDTVFQGDAEDATVFTSDPARDDTTFSADAESEATIPAVANFSDDTVFGSNIVETDGGFKVQGDEAASEEEPARPEQPVSGVAPPALAAFSAAPGEEATWESVEPEEASFGSGPREEAAFATVPPAVAAVQPQESSLDDVQLEEAEFAALQVEEASLDAVQPGEAVADPVQPGEASSGAFQTDDGSFADAEESTPFLVDAAPEDEASFQADGVPSWGAEVEPEPDLTDAAVESEAGVPEDLAAPAESPQPSAPAERTPVLVEVVPGDIVVISVEDPAAPAASEDEPDEDTPETLDEPEIETQEEIVAAAEYEDEIDEPADVPEFAELAQLAYEGVAEPAPDPLAMARAQIFGAYAAEHEDGAEVGGAAALAEVLVRLLERDGTAMRAESSLRRLLAAALARELGLPAAQQEALALAALLGSLGELAEPAPNGSATGRQLSITLQLLAGVELPAAAREALAHQCERWDGAGLPSGLREDQIPFPARILAVARAAAALLGGRGAGASGVVDELQRQAGSAFDPLVVSVLRRVFAQRERHGIGYGWGGRVAVAHPHELRALELAARLHGEGYAAETAGTAAALRDRLRAGAPEALVLGADLPDADAAALVREVRAQSATLPVLVVDAPDARRRVELLGAGADVCFPPNADFLEVRATLDALLRRGER